MKKRNIIILSISSLIIIIVATILLIKNNHILSQNKITILDATYTCDNYKEDFYEDDTYIYTFPCTKSNSIYVKLSNGNKILVKTVLEEEKISIEELEKAGLDFTKRKK